MKRRALQIIVFLLLGAIVNVAVAWSLAFYYNPRVPTYYSADATRWSNFGSDRWFHFVGAVAHRPTTDVLRTGRLPSRTDLEGIPEARMMQLFRQSAVGGFVWAKAQRSGISEMDGPIPTYNVPAPTLGHYEYWAIDFRGWPLRAMSCNFYPEPPPGGCSDLRNGILLTPYQRSTIPFCERILPTRIVWPGFAINTIFYAAVLWVMFFAPFALRRRLRARRGLCPACAYPVGTSPVCTECGKSVKIN